MTPREVADAVLHEGVLLYPYASSALKNRHPYPFGALYPEAFCRAHDAGDAWWAETACVAFGAGDARIAAELRFLDHGADEPVVREARTSPCTLAALADAACPTALAFGAVRARLELAASPAGPTTWKLRVRVANETALEDPEQATRGQALALALASAHVLISIENGEFASQIDPPEAVRELAASCRNVGLWPVLAGRPPRRDVMLAAPIILYDYPELAPESRGDFFDGTEIDELLTLRILTLAPDEKRAMAASGPRAKALLERTEAEGLAPLSELHGRLRAPPRLAPGASVRLRPKGRADILDLALDGRQATVRAIERDLEGRVHVAVTVDDDPGADLDVHGHRFFFRPEEIELP